jgi:hypothetical protein
MFVVNNLYLFEKNSDRYEFATRNGSDLHLPLSKLKLYQKGPKFSGIKLYNKLLVHIKEWTNNKKSLRRLYYTIYILTHSIVRKSFLQIKTVKDIVR